MKKNALAVLLLVVSFMLFGGGGDAAAASGDPLDHPECSEERLESCPVYCPVYCRKIGFKSFTCNPDWAPANFCCFTGGRVPSLFRP